MKYKQLLFIALPTVLLVAARPTGAFADDDDWFQRNRISAAYRMGFNINASFRNVGAGPFANNPSITGYSYGDGFVGTDSTGNAGGLTTRFGYQSGSQAVDGNASLLMHVNSPGSLADNSTENPSHGLEITMNNEIGRVGSFHWGVESAFSWSQFGFHEAGIASASVASVDAFALGYSPPASTPYIGPVGAAPFTPLLGTSATHLPVFVDSRLQGDSFGLHLGPYLDVPICRSLTATFSAGLLLDIMASRYSTIQSYTTPGGAPMVTAGTTSDCGVLPGGYASAKLMMKLSEHSQLFGGVQYEGSESYKTRNNGMEAGMDLGAAFYCTFGLGFSF